jgi:hypothetical protein
MRGRCLIAEEAAKPYRNSVHGRRTTGSGHKGGRSHKHDNEPGRDQGVYASNCDAEIKTGHDALRLGCPAQYITREPEFGSPEKCTKVQLRAVLHSQRTTPPERNMIARRRWFRCRALKSPGEPRSAQRVPRFNDKPDLRSSREIPESKVGTRKRVSPGSLTTPEQHPSL